MPSLTPYRLPWLHFNSRSSQVSRQEVLEAFAEEGSGRGTGSDPYYAFGQNQGGAAWHAVAMARKARAERGG